MGCIIEFSESQLQIEFCTEGNKQKILIDVLLKYSEMDINQLAISLGVSESKIQNIYDDKDFLVDQQADSLAQIFLRFFGRKFFRKFSIIRNYTSDSRSNHLTP